ncbi:MAG: squalene/phytoene synthase family protein, partial [Elusimicrobiales bacterium]
MMTTREILKRTSRSLYLSARALPAYMRPAFSCAYLLCRAADTIADTEAVPRARRLERIRRFPLLPERRPLRKAALARLAEEISAPDGG